MTNKVAFKTDEEKLWGFRGVGLSVAPLPLPQLHSLRPEGSRATETGIRRAREPWMDARILGKDGLDSSQKSHFICNSPLNPGPKCSAWGFANAHIYAHEVSRTAN